MTDDDDSTGYKLHLTGGLINSMLTLDEHLKLRWLDTRTRHLYVEFQIHTPNTDSVAMVKICMTTECGLLYTISKTGVSITFSNTTRY